jgi:hypothetical protein
MKLIVDAAEVLDCSRIVAGDMLVVIPEGIELPAENATEPLNPFWLANTAWSLPVVPAISEMLEAPRLIPKSQTARLIRAPLVRVSPAPFEFVVEYVPKIVTL